MGIYVIFKTYAGIFIMNNSETLFAKAQKLIPGGVNSPVRAFKGVGGTPIFVHKGLGSRLTDVAGKDYIDYVCTWGATILGHAHPAILNAVIEAASNGFGFGTPTEKEVLFAEKIRALMPSLEMIRLVNSGTEATMTAIRLARGYTGRDTIIKFEGCYHGHSDALLVKAGSGAITLGIPSSKGVPESVAKDTIILPYNDAESVKTVFSKYGERIASIIVEPIAGNMNCVLPVPGFLTSLRDLCNQYQSILIFDEVMTGFRVAQGGAQALYGIAPDLTTLGKVIGGGLPLAAVGGKQQIMEYLAPIGPVYQAGTLSGNPIAVAAGLAVLHEISKPGFYDELSSLTEALIQNLIKIGKATGIPITGHAIGGMFGFFFAEEKQITRFDQVTRSNIDLFKRFFHRMLLQGVYFAPSVFEAGFITQAHTMREIGETTEAAESVMKSIHSIKKPPLVRKWSRGLKRKEI